MIEVGWLRCGKSFKGEGGDFKGDTLFDREPVKSAKGWRNVIASLVIGKDDASKRVLDGLKAVEGSVREIVKEGITVIEARRNKRVGEGDSSIGVKERSNLSEGPKLEEGGLTDSGDVVCEGVVRIEGNSEVEGSSGRRDSVVVKGNGGVDDLGTLLRCANDEEFSFGRVKGKFVGGEPEVKRVKDVSKSGKRRRIVGRGEGDVKLGVISIEMKVNIRGGKYVRERGGV